MRPLILAVLVVLLLILAYLANLRATYIDIFRTYGVYRSPTCPNPWKIALAIERPWVQRAFMARPITTPVALFATYLVRAKDAQLADLCVGFYQPNPSCDVTCTLDALTASQAVWESNSPLAIRFAVPYDAPIVNLYLGAPTEQGAARIKETLPLAVLFGAGFLALAELMTTSAATSLEDLWRLCFAEQIPQPAKGPAKPTSQCESAGSHGLSGAFGGAGLGVMIGAALAPETAGLSALFGALIGGLGGGVAGVAANNGPCCLVGTFT
jgi:hypothetical protein